MRALNIFLYDIRYQFKYGFYFLYTVISIVYIVILLFIPEDFLRPIASIIILTDPAALGFFFIGGMVLLERGEGLHSYYSISPATTKEYVLGKTLSLSLISTISGIAITAVAIRGEVNFVLLFLGLFLGSAVFTMFGLIVGTISKSLNQYFVIGVPVGIFLMLPAFLPLVKINHFLIETMPSTLILRVIHGAL